MPAAVTRLIASFAYGKLVHDGFTLAIVGRPNVGKSSLFNRLLEQDRAIVTDIPGTTRDLVSETAAMEGIPVRFVDTAGIRLGQDVVEKLGIERSYQAMADADLTVVVVDGSEPATPEDHELIRRASEQGKFLVAAEQDATCRRGWTCPKACRFPRSPAQGIADTAERHHRCARPAGRMEQEGGFITSLRHEQLLKEAREALEQAAQGDGVRHPARDAAARPLRRAPAHRRDHRRDHRGRYPEPHLLHLLHRKISEPFATPGEEACA